MSLGPAWSGGLIVAGLLLAPAAASEEIIRLKNGGMVRGTLTKQAATEVMVETEMGTITLAPDAILSIEHELDAEAPGQPLEAGWERGEPTAQPGTVLPADRPAPPPAAPSEAKAQPSLADASKAVVLIGAFYEDGSVALGSGVVVSDRGLIITNRHVVDGAEEIKVAIPDAEAKISLARFPKEHTARLLKVHECYDLALLRIPKETPHYLRFAEDGNITVGISVSAIGNPGGVLTASVSKGVISGIRTMAD
ncbi:MAG: trypsin-like peptidase domain-containing protein, partial [Candidatus Omnitrophica bacterium]|nr:trypsin-like peptidase domain-containing protein [Candidatus Omnitrophota bacterium]